MSRKAAPRGGAHFNARGRPVLCTSGSSTHACTSASRSDNHCPMNKFHELDISELYDGSGEESEVDEQQTAANLTPIMQHPSLVPSTQLIQPIWAQLGNHRASHVISDHDPAASGPSTSMSSVQHLLAGLISKSYNWSYCWIRLPRKCFVLFPRMSIATTTKRPNP